MDAVGHLREARHGQVLAYDHADAGAVVVAKGAGVRVGRVLELAGGLEHALASLGADGLARRVVDHVGDGRRRDTGLPCDVLESGPLAHFASIATE